MSRFDFVNPGAAMFDGLKNLLREREIQRRTDVAEAEAAARLKMDQDSSVRANEAATRQAEIAKIQLDQAKANLKKQEKEGAAADLGKLKPGEAVTGDLAAQAKRLIPGMVNITPGQLPSATLPMPTTPVAPEMPVEGQAPVAPGPTMAPVETAGIDETITNKGTPQQIAMDELRKSGKVSPEIIAMVEAGVIDGSALATLLKPKVIKQIFRWTKEGELEGQDAKGNWVKHIGSLPEAYEIRNEPGANAGGGVGTKLFQDDTGTYLLTTDTSGNTTKNRVGGLRPFAGQAATITRGNAALVTGDTVMSLFNPDWVGPLAGRYNSMATALTETMGPQGFAFFESQVNSMKNQAIKAITGAQMSEPEATRIMKELPDVNLPPAAFKARMESFMQNLAIASQIEQMYAEGRKEEAFELRIKQFGAGANALAATEERLQKLFPNVKVTSGSTSSKTPAVVAPSGAKDTGEWEVVGGVRMRKVGR